MDAQLSLFPSPQPVAQALISRPEPPRLLLPKAPSYSPAWPEDYPPGHIVKCLQPTGDKCHLWGLFQEDSDIRAHVGVLSRTVYVCQTRQLINTVVEQERRLRAAPVHQWVNGIRTVCGWGYPTPIDLIAERADLRPIHLPSQPQFVDLLHLFDGIEQDSDDTTKKGQQAVAIVKAMHKRGLLPTWGDAIEVTDRDRQIKGQDMIVLPNGLRVQVKCDYRAGPRTVPGCTGNAFLQWAEWNPHGKH